VKYIKKFLYSTQFYTAPFSSFS